MNKMIILAFAGKSGCGKSTLIQEYKEKYGDKVNVIKSYTTRAVRENDPNDINTHVFVSEEVWQQNKDKAVAIYYSPKGYMNWVDPSLFEEGKLNLYAIDPKALSEQLEPYCRENGVTLHSFYITMPESLRKRRIMHREGTLKYFPVDKHLDREVCKVPHWFIKNNAKVQDMFDEFEGIIENLREAEGWK